MNRVLFLCTGNYYRSRFAEECFNHIAGRQNKNWRAGSRGLAENMNALRNPGPISKYTIFELEKRGIIADDKGRFPKSLNREEINEYQLIIALNEAEHRPIVESRFPEMKRLITYWNIKDVEESSPEKQMELLFHNIIKLTDSIEDTDLDG